jgi:hypothetical protein
MNAPKANRCIDVPDDVMVQVLRRMTPAQKFAMVCRAGRRIHSMAGAYVRSIHPDWDAARVQAEVMRRARG